jgi:arylsulfatase A-like enzyme
MFRPLSFLFLFLGITISGHAAERMNVVFFLVDDFGYHDLSITGSPLYETPSIDELAKSGMLLTQAYSAYPRCVPSRFAMISGVHPSRAVMEGENPGNLSPSKEKGSGLFDERGVRESAGYHRLSPP